MNMYVRRYWISVSLFFYLSISCLSQSGWILQNPFPHGGKKNLKSVSFINSSIGTVVGDGGTILHTTDGGTTWTQQPSGTTNLLCGVSFINAQVGTVVGSNGTILHTTDGGATWTQQSSGIQDYFRGVCFTDVNNGIVFSYSHVIRSTDGGSNWTIVFSRSNGTFTGISFSDANNGTIVRDGGGIRTTDGGATWKDIQLSQTLFCVCFTDSCTGTVGGEFGSIYNSTNAGVSWNSQFIGNGPGLFGVSFGNKATGTIVGEWGTIVRTTDGGATWISQSGITKNNLYAVCFTDAETGTAVGDSGTIIRTTTGGTTRIENETSVPNQFRLHQNFPNPFSPSTTISFTIPSRSFVSLKIFDALGKEVSMLVDGDLDMGQHSFLWNAEGLRSGMYLCRLHAGSQAATQKLTLIR
jgi:photosystem II stability/assembly factor-like uncharacterized protein